MHKKSAASTSVDAADNCITYIVFLVIREFLAIGKFLATGKFLVT